MSNPSNLKKRVDALAIKKLNRVINLSKIKYIKVKINLLKVDKSAGGIRLNKSVKGGIEG